MAGRPREARRTTSSSSTSAAQDGQRVRCASSSWRNIPDRVPSTSSWIASLYSSQVSFPVAQDALQPLAASISRIRIRALCTCDFDVPSAMPSCRPLRRDRSLPRRAARRPRDSPGAIVAMARSRSSRSTRKPEEPAAPAAAPRRIVGGLLLPVLPASQVIQAAVRRQPVNPGAERSLAFEAPQLPVHQQENLLQQVLAVVGRTGHPARQT